MHPILTVTLPFFALVLCGWYGARRHILPESAIPGLNAFVLYFALPCLLFRFGMNTPIAQLLNPSIIVLWLGCAAIIVGGTIAATIGRKLRLKDAALGALVAAFPNSGFMGVPLLVALLGESAAGPMICAILVDLLFTTSLCVGLAQAHPASPTATKTATKTAPKATPVRRSLLPARLSFAAPKTSRGRLGWRMRGQGLDSAWPSSLPSEPAPTEPSFFAMGSAARFGSFGGAGPRGRRGRALVDADTRAAIGRAVKGALSNPMPWAVVAGALFSLAQVKPSGPIYAVISMLADAASPVALFTIGAVLWRSGQKVRKPAPLSRVLPVVAIKLVLHPLLVLAGALTMRRLGAPLPFDVITVLVLTAALPSASNVSILAERFGADNGRIARIIMLSTALAFVTFSALAWMFDMRPHG